MNPSGAENNFGEGALLHTIDATIEQMKASEAVAEQTRQELAALLADKVVGQAVEVQADIEQTILVLLQAVNQFQHKHILFQ